MLGDAPKRHYYLSMLLAFLIPVYQKAVPIAIILIAVNWLTLGKRAFRFNDLWANKPAFLLVLFYLWHVVAMLWSSNKSFGGLDLEIKLSFLLLPIVYSAFGRFKVLRFENVLTAYIVGCLTAIGIGVVNSLYAYYADINPFLDFYNVNISPVLHISYFAMYLNMALVIVIYKIIKNESNFYSWSNAFLIISSFVFALATFLSTSRNGFLGLLFLLLIILTYAIVRYRKWLLGISLVLMVWIIASSILKDVVSGQSGINGFDKVSKVINSEKIDKKEGESTGVRILVWKSAINVIKRNIWMGTGTGDVKDELMAEYLANEYEKPYQRQYNAHNQYLNTTVALGIVGLLILLAALFYPAAMAFVRYNYLYFMLGVNLAVSALTESILEVQAGVVFFAFFTAILSPIMNASVNSRFKFLKFSSTQ